MAEKESKRDCPYFGPAHNYVPLVVAAVENNETLIAVCSKCGDTI